MEVVRNSSTVLSEDPVSMSVVNIDNRLVLFRELHDVLQRRDVAVHAEDSVSDHKDSSKLFRVCKLFFQVIHATMLVDTSLCPSQAAAINDAAMVELIADDEVSLIN